MHSLTFTKGHGTRNDFVIVLDREDMHDPSPDEVRAVCDRRAGIGGDGLLRAVKAGRIAEWDGDPDLWFMDYRNADGSVAEMCGNGVRVFARYLADNGLADGPVIPIATRSGVREATLLPDRRVRVDVGTVTVEPGAVKVTAAGLDQAVPATKVDVGNPHAVAFVDDPAVLDLTRPPVWEPAEAFPAGVNCEFVRIVGERHVEMRVFERGVGETLSCGTGTVAVAAAAAEREGVAERPVTYRVDVPGGTVEVELAGGDGVEQAFLTGPAVIVGHGEFTLPEG
ncbi:diaminopimelate epimerase [Microlunatus parietis]|uniref:Diaminopimelate epimerase n=1 Tax=Microlunatus parietis TaxID=682979 RepID=A0A7Y9I335_9ACTN|nr:diaminopimelate epimerase [Microlunatus parietis]NYE69326.1 diaminopimelate epimerase [Microlunatus parietis]